MSFPVWRELKQSETRDAVERFPSLQCPFPFEGNWNSIPMQDRVQTRLLTMSFPVWRELKHSPVWANNLLSLVYLQCPFPFEGNWNNFPWSTVWPDIIRLTMSFPVWRELKLYRLARVCWEALLTMSFPVWRELKLSIEEESQKMRGITLQCPFPFEGNWNSLRLFSRVRSCLALTMSFPVWRELKLV